MMDSTYIDNQLRDLGLANREAIVLDEVEDRRYAHLKPGDEDKLLAVSKPKLVDPENEEALNSWRTFSIDNKARLRQEAENDPLSKADAEMFSGQLHRLRRQIDIQDGLIDHIRTKNANADQERLERERLRYQRMQEAQAASIDQEYRSKAAQPKSKKSAPVPSDPSQSKIQHLWPKVIENKTPKSKRNRVEKRAALHGQQAIWNLSTKRIPPKLQSSPGRPRLAIDKDFKLANPHDFLAAFENMNSKSFASQGTAVSPTTMKQAAEVSTGARSSQDLVELAQSWNSQSPLHVKSKEPAGGHVSTKENAPVRTDTLHFGQEVPKHNESCVSMLLDNKAIVAAQICPKPVENMDLMFPGLETFNSKLHLQQQRDNLLKEIQDLTSRISIRQYLLEAIEKRLAKLKENEAAAIEQNAPKDRQIPNQLPACSDLKILDSNYKLSLDSKETHTPLVETRIQSTTKALPKANFTGTCLQVQPNVPQIAIQPLACNSSALGKPRSASQDPKDILTSDSNIMSRSAPAPYHPASGNESRTDLTKGLSTAPANTRGLRSSRYAPQPGNHEVKSPPVVSPTTTNLHSSKHASQPATIQPHSQLKGSGRMDQFNGPSSNNSYGRLTYSVNELKGIGNQVGFGRH